MVIKQKQWRLFLSRTIEGSKIIPISAGAETDLRSGTTFVDIPLDVRSGSMELRNSCKDIPSII